MEDTVYDSFILMIDSCFVAVHLEMHMLKLVSPPLAQYKCQIEIIRLNLCIKSGLNAWPELLLTHVHS
jgi:hypothetical protein